MKYTKVYDKAQFVAYNQIYKAGMEARKLKNYMYVNGAAFFLDSSFDVFKNWNSELVQALPYCIMHNLPYEKGYFLQKLK